MICYFSASHPVFSPFVVDLLFFFRGELTISIFAVAIVLVMRTRLLGTKNETYNCKSKPLFNLLPRCLVDDSFGFGDERSGYEINRNLFVVA